MSIDFNLVYKKKGEIVTRKIAGETLLVPIRGQVANMQKVFALNEVAEFIWSRIDGKRSLATIRDGILSDFSAEKAQVEADIRELIAQLQESGLIEKA